MLNGNNYDWHEGDTIVIASNSEDMTEAEVKTITGRYGSEIYVDSYFNHYHFSGSEDYDISSFNFRTQIALLNRNI